jgi:signal transduction histidine kinase
MNNIAKHSGAENIHIFLIQNHSGIELCITDNGVGFDLNNPATLKALKKGFGITGMKERTELSGGTFEIRSVPGNGTRIRARWPVLV